MKAEFGARIEAARGGGHYLAVPSEAAAKVGLRARARVRGTLDGAPYRSSLMKSGAAFLLGVHKATLAAAGAKVGQAVKVTLELDDEPLPEDTVPEVLVSALAKNAAARRAWQALSPSHRREHVRYVNEAKKDETRRARAERTVKALLP